MKGTCQNPCRYGLPRVSCAYVIGLKFPWAAKHVTRAPCVNVEVSGTLSSGAEDEKAFCIETLGFRDSWMDKTDSKGPWEDKVELRTFGVIVDVLE